MRGNLRFGSRSILLHILLAIVVGLIVSYAVVSAPHSPKIESHEGVLDLTQVHVGKKPIQLQGDWTFYWHELLSPEDIRIRSAKDGIHDRWIGIPSSWLGYRIDDRQLKGTGFATFKLDIKLSEQDRNERLALRLPTIFHSYKLWVNGELLAAGCV